MNILGRIRTLSFRAYLKAGHLCHVRYWRGHGIHSPFMYSIVRQVFMKRGVRNDSLGVYSLLRKHGMGPKDAVRVQNLYSHMRYNSITIIDKVPAATDKLGGHSGALYVVIDPAAEAYIFPLAETLSGGINTLVISGARRSRGRNRTCHALYRHAPCVSVDKGGLMYYFFDHRIQPAHYKL